MLPNDGPSGPKHVRAIARDILSENCSILCFNKECICWQKSSVLNIYLYFMGNVKYSKHAVSSPTALGIPPGCLGTYMIELC
jgi:hypothetical protein